MAAPEYFGKTLFDLNLVESAALAALIKPPIGIRHQRREGDYRDLRETEFGSGFDAAQLSGEILERLDRNN